MALETQYNTESGIELEKAYVKIGSLFGTKSLINMQILIFKDKGARDSNLKPVFETKLSFTPDLEIPKNFISQGYDSLKNDVPGFLNAIDC